MSQYAWHGAVCPCVEQCRGCWCPGNGTIGALTGAWSHVPPLGLHQAALRRPPGQAADRGGREAAEAGRDPEAGSLRPAQPRPRLPGHGPAHGGILRNVFVRAAGVAAPVSAGQRGQRSRGGRGPQQARQLGGQHGAGVGAGQGAARHAPRHQVPPRPAPHSGDV